MDPINKIVITIKGKKQKKKLEKTVNVRFAAHTGIDTRTVFEGDNYIGSYNYLQNCQLGRGSYIGRNSTLQNAVIGRYCSIGAEVQLLGGRHPSREFVSTHPAFYSVGPVTGKTYINKQKFQEEVYIDDAGHQIKIGNDVWIGQGAALMEGIRIGDGAIVGAKAVVTKDVAPYSIVAGIPAGEIRKRFSEGDIDWLLSFQWWNQDEKWISSHAASFENVDLLKKQVISSKQ